MKNLWKMSFGDPDSVMCSDRNDRQEAVSETVYLNMGSTVHIRRIRLVRGDGFGY